VALDPYRLAAPVYDLIFERMNRGLRAVALKLVPPSPGQTVLDIGCGTGLHLALYQERGCAAFGIDPSEAMLRQASRRLGDHLCRGDATALPFAAGTFDLVTTTLVLHEMSPEVRRAVLAEAARVLRPDGRLLVIDFNPGPARPLKGWLVRAFIRTAERVAGERHHKNYRQFIASGGLPALAGGSLALEQQKIVGGGNMGIYVLRPRPGSAGASIRAATRSR